MSKTITLFVPDQFVSESRKVDFVYRHKGTVEALREVIAKVVAMQPVPEDYSTIHEYDMACQISNTRFHTLTNMVTEIEATWMLASLVKPWEES